MSDDHVKILFWDTETSPMLLCKFDLKPEWTAPANIVQDWFTICAQWSWNNDKKIYTSSILDDPARFKKNPTDDFHVIKTMHEVLSSADIIVAHNNDGFDWPKFMARVIYHRMPPINYTNSVDTLKEARRFGFTSKALAHLCEHLSLSRKLKSDHGAFKQAALGDIAAIESIIKYGRGDVPALKDLYYRLRPYMKSHPNLNLFRDDDGASGCPHCGHTVFIKKGFVYNKTTVYQEYLCKNSMCRKRFKGTQTIKRTEVT